MVVVVHNNLLWCEHKMCIGGAMWTDTIQFKVIHNGRCYLQAKVDFYTKNNKLINDSTYNQI